MNPAPVEVPVVRLIFDEGNREIAAIMEIPMRFDNDDETRGTRYFDASGAAISREEFNKRISA
jgi:hypothetical protein